MKEQIKQAQSIYLKAEKTLMDLVHKYEADVDRVKKEQKFNPAIKIFSSITIGCKTNQWEPHLYVAGDHFYEDDPLDIVNVRGVKKSELEEVRNKLEKVFPELKVEISYKQRPPRDSVRVWKDLSYYLGPSAELVCEGNIWYKGWDIKDRYFVVKQDGKYRYFMSTDGHGGGVEEIEEENSFLSFIEQDKDNNWVRDYINETPDGGKIAEEK